MDEIDAVLDFCFSEAVAPKWFVKDPDFDTEVARVLGPLLERARAGAFGHWPATARGALALVLLFDQAPRNLFRDSPEAYALDPRARALTRQAVTAGLDRDLAQDRRLFLYLPLQHSEVLADQNLSVELFGQLDEDPDCLVYAERHREIVQRFGRFPHRNAALGRETTAEEADFLTQPNSSF
ncbi:DUF924 family protein [Algihabitans albus]|uniref:DUF924 family protein n=1 Tax=Algihabitans albus TaxID=2164067 RepID=UPI000E5D9BBD|nr:DUF924 family protein [Algihabitans albus]